MSPYYSVKKLAAVRDYFKNNSSGHIKIDNDGFNEKIIDGSQWHAWFCDCLNNKINRGLPCRGRKDNEIYITEMRRGQRLLRQHVSHRIAIHGYDLYYPLRKRFEHYITEEGR
jgi:hypothetical protein